MYIRLRLDFGEWLGWEEGSGAWVGMWNGDLSVAALWAR